METYYYNGEKEKYLEGNLFICDYMDFVIKNEKDQKFISYNFP